MKKSLLTLLALVCLSARAWDVEHDEVAQLTAEALPSEIRSFFTFDDFGILMANCHYPDWIEWAMPDGSHRSHTLAEMAESVGEEDAALLKEQGISESIDFHGTRPRAVLLTMLARAFGRGDHARAAFYLSLLTHVVSDISALNHPPLQQFARCSRFPGVDSPSRKVEAGAKNDFGFRSDGHVVHLVRERMRGYSPKPLAADWPAALLAFAVDEVRQGAFSAEKEGLVAFASQPEAEAALVDLVAMQVCALEDMVATAWRFRSPAAAFPAADFDAAFARESGRVAAEIDPARQAVFAEVFDTARNPAQPTGTVFIVCEPYGYLACRSLSFAGRIIVAIAARTLRDAGYAVRGVTLASVGKTGLPKPAKTDAVLVSLGPGEVDDAVVRAFRAYREQGGRLVALGGYDPKDVTGLRDLLERQADDAVPVSSQWGVRNEEVWNRMSVVFAGRSYPFVRNPNVNGYCKPYASYVFKLAADVRPLLVLDNGRSRRVAGARKGRVAWLPEYALMPFVLSESKTFDWATLRLDEPGRSILLAALAELAGPRVVLPEKYHRDPGAEFALVLVTDLAEPTRALQAFADDYKDAVFVCAKGRDRAALIRDVCEGYRVFRFPRGRIDLESSDLAKPEAKKCLENYIRWGHYQAEPPALTRYGARVYRRERKAGEAPSVKLPKPWRLVEGDDGATGCDSRLYYFTVEADGFGLPPPVVEVAWPGVAISSVDGATNVTLTADGLVLTPTAKSGGANYLTMVQDGAIELALHHHVEGAQHGPYGGKPLPWGRIRASDNWRAACREIFHLAGLADPKATDGASIKLYGFDSNFPNRHVDHPEHFHVMLEWDDWQKNNVGHYTLDERGFIRGNNFLVCGDVAGGLSGGYHPQKPRETTEYVGPSGKTLFSLEMLEGGVGLVLRKPGSDAAWRIQSDRPAESIRMSVRPDAASEWEEIGNCAVTDDTEQGRYAIRYEDKGELRTETFRYERDTGRLAEADWIGDGEKDRVEATFYDEDPAPEFTAAFVLPRGKPLAEVSIACAGYYAIKLNGRAAGVSATTLMPLWSPFDRTIYADTFEANGLLPFPATNVISVTLGNGFYNLPPLRFWGSKCFRESLAHGRPCFKLSVEGVAEPLRWTCRKTSILRNCVYLGAEVDATRGPTDGHPAARVFGPKGAIVPRRAPAVEFTGSAEGRLVARPDGTYLVDFGANLSGVPRFEFAREPRGRKIEIVYGERLNADGSVNVLTQTAGQIKTDGKGGPGAPCPACQRDTYVCGGAAVEVFEPPFTWHIGRYAEIRGVTHEPKSAKLKIVSSALKGVADPGDVPAEFKALHEVCVRTFRNNLIGVQSDCPGRERLGYGGDIVATCEAMCLNFDMLEFYLKTLQDFADEAEGDGWITETAPFVGIADADGLEAGGASRKGPVSWALAVPVLMDTLLRHYPSAADRILAYYPVCARYVRLMASAYPSGIVPKCIGDHEALERAPDEATATAHWHEFVRLTATFAKTLGKSEDAADFEAIARKVKSAFAAKYVRAGIVANGTQSAQAMALYLGLVPEDQVKAAERRLVEAVEEKDCAPHTGIFSTRYMLEYLSTHGYDALARKLVLHRGFPGWLHMLENGATTLWETWKESDDVYSNCHPMFGSVDEWILKCGRR